MLGQLKWLLLPLGLSELLSPPQLKVKLTSCAPPEFKDSFDTVKS